jgi:putative ABC transport system permease protein
MAAITADPALDRQIAVITPQVSFAGIAGNHEEDNSKTFLGKGLVPSDYNRMRTWDAWSLGVGQAAVPLEDADREGAIVGVGMARMIGLCDELRMAPACQDPPKAAPTDAPEADFSGLIPDVTLVAAGDGAEVAVDARPQLDLLAAATGGAPNIVSVGVSAAMAQPTRAVDNAMVMLHFAQAQRLVYGDADRASAVLVQLKDPAAMDPMKAQIADRLKAAGLDMEVLAFNEVDPTFNRVLGMFSVIFGAIAIVLGIVVVFTITNTVTMNVMERIREVGTVRAMGFRRLTVFRQFLAEGLLLGVAGALLAAGLAIGLAAALNDAGITWTPPSNATPLTIELMVTENPLLLAAIVGFLSLLTVLASVPPALRAVRIPIVRALHHV